MNIKKTACVAFVFVTFTVMSAYARSIQAATPMQLATTPHPILAQLSGSQLAQCQQEQAQLNQQLNQCTTNACRQQVQAAIAAHNARCR